MSRRTLASVGGGGLRLATGAYTGNNAATQAIAGVGFRPRAVFVFRRTVAGGASGFWPTLKTDTMTDAFAVRVPTGSQGTVPDVIVSLDADGFTVGDGTGAPGNLLNENGVKVYTYVCWA